MTGFRDANQTPINYGSVIEHIGHGERYTVDYPGTGGYFENHEGAILMPHTAKHQGAFKLTELRASKARVIS